MSSSSPLPSVLLVGCGKMGNAMLEGWLKHGLKPSVVLDRHDHALPSPHHHARTVADIPADFTPDIVIVAVKPQKADAILEELGQRFPTPVLLSVMAGRSIESLTKTYKKANPSANPTVVRAMPNTPCAIGAGITGLYAEAGTTAEQKDQCDALLRSVGETVWVEQENLIDAVTAVSGSGPAYIFLLAELMEKAGIEQGLPPETARKLARRTIFGAGALLDHSALDASELRIQVTSPGGTTAEALKILMQPDAWPKAVSQAISAAAHRAHELSS
ncbi:pyrroline-5-carboxylate reductase [Acetobacter indonesiensis]|uniref:pyrroline-5-carboxylate reductase n=1 Tax=Acetobacter indonesiensis TaxID=104101 RepID=UPI001F01E4ED|nr:pyrroline-5-carboxylate reductase [Acetobacter indonesiensis]MCG0994823.1 pyrroline-5-carboxylate reductase [Acetobacter indonesiensis]